MEVDSGEKLSGFELDEDIQIKIIGNRGGEKLKEELWSEREKVSKTHNPYILRIVESDNSFNKEDFFAKLDILEKAALKFDTEEIKSLLKEIISEHKV